MLISQKSPMARVLHELEPGTLFRLEDSSDAGELFVRCTSNIGYPTPNGRAMVFNLTRSKVVLLHSHLRVVVQAQSGPLVVYPAWVDEKT